MKIIQLIQKPQFRGAEIFASQLSNHLISAGHDVTMISLLPGEAQLPFKGKLVRFDRPLNKRFIDFSGWRQLAHYVKEYKPDVVQANAGDTLKFAVLSKVIFRWDAPLVSRNANKVSDFINSWQKLAFNKLLVRQLSHVISVSEICRQDFIKTYKYNESKTTTVPIGIESQTVRASLAEDLKPIFGTGRVLIHVASFVPEKNHTGLLRIIKKVIDRGEDVKILLVGDGRLKPVIEKQVVDSGLSDRVFLMGYRSDVLSMMSNAHAFILSSKIEGLPGVILEAMQCRLPVVAYDVGGISEVIKPGTTGWLVKPGDEDGFASAIIEILHATNLDTIKDNAFNLIVKEFNNTVIAVRFLEVYQKIM